MCRSAVTDQEIIEAGERIALDGKKVCGWTPACCRCRRPR
jgi:hypothetical protein